MISMINYYNRIIEPILSAVCEEMKRKWLTKTAITQGQRIKFFRDPLRLVSMNNIANIGEKLIHNEIATPNEVRGILGLRPSKDPASDQIGNRDLYPTEGNSNTSQENPDAAQEIQNEEFPSEEQLEGMSEEEIEKLMAELDEYDSQLDELEKEAQNA